MCKIENLVFEGGGVRACAFAGAIKCLQQYGVLANIKRVAGSSAGALAATMIAIGFDAEEFSNNMMTTDFNSFLDANTGCFSAIKNAVRMFKHYAWHRGDKLEQAIGQLLQKYSGNYDLTFADVYQKYGKVLVVTATDVRTARTIYFHHLSYPNIKVRTAVRASMGMPLYFPPIELDGMLLVDGGILNNYPIWIFENDTPLPLHSGHANLKVHKECICLEKTIGFKLVGPDEQPDVLLFHGVLDTSRIYYYLLAIIECMSWQIERSGIQADYWERTVLIPTLGVKSTDFDLSFSTKQILCDNGYIATSKFFGEHIKRSTDELELEAQELVSAQTNTQLTTPTRLKRRRRVTKKSMLTIIGE